MDELWSLFPRLMEQKINSLLDRAEPNQIKAFQLYKTCQREGLWKESFEKFSAQIQHFFSVPIYQRRKSDLDSLMDHPVDALVFEEFQLSFKNALVDSKALQNIVSWAHQLIRVNCKTTSVVASSDVLGKTLNYVTSPPNFEKDLHIDFEDFCEAWKKIVFGLFGKKHDSEFNRIINELEWLNAKLKISEREEKDKVFVPTIYLTQTEIDWVTAIQKAVFVNEVAPKFPLSKGPQKPRLMDLERAADLYAVVQKSKLPELIKHRENIKTTILDHCERLLRERAK